MTMKVYPVIWDDDLQEYRPMRWDEIMEARKMYEQNRKEEQKNREAREMNGSTTLTLRYSSPHKVRDIKINGLQTQQKKPALWAKQANAAREAKRAGQCRAAPRASDPDPYIKMQSSAQPLVSWLNCCQNASRAIVSTITGYIAMA